MPDDIVKKVEELLKLPQELCNTCGQCCRISAFKGGLHHNEVLKIADGGDNDPAQVAGAKDFLSIFAPYELTEDAKKVAPEFVERSMKHFNKKENEISFYTCKFLDEENLCLIHEDRPLLCRMYPVPHELTLYFPGCGFEKRGKQNWKEICNIIKSLEN